MAGTIASFAETSWNGALPTDQRTVDSLSSRPVKRCARGSDLAQASQPSVRGPVPRFLTVACDPPSSDGACRTAPRRPGPLVGP